MLLRMIRALQAGQQRSSAWQTCCHLDQRYKHRSHKICCSNSCTCFCQSAVCLLSAFSVGSVGSKILELRCT